MYQYLISIVKTIWLVIQNSEDISNSGKCSLTHDVLLLTLDEVNLSDLPSIYQGVWPATFCHLPS